tara:strand:- start:1282 stop:2874 length:1593 start_codon:yes stop_codon:yes gene_type:complete
MAAKKTSAEKAREDAENARVENMLDGAFGTLSGLEINKAEESTSEETIPGEELADMNEANSEISDDNAEVDEIIENEVISSSNETKIPEEEKSTPPELPISNSEGEEVVDISENLASNEPPSGPPSGPPSKGPPSKPPSGPPSKGPPSKPPSGPPSKGPPSKPPSGPPSKGPPSESPSETQPEDNPSEILGEEKVDQVNEETSGEEVEQTTEGATEDSTKGDDSEESSGEDTGGQQDSGQELEESDVSTEIESSDSQNEIEMDDLSESDDEIIEEVPAMEDALASDNIETEAEIARLSAEVERLRKSMAGAAEVIEDLENPPMPPAMLEDLVIGAHIVGDMARLARQLDREQLIRASMGSIAMLHPEQLEIIISTKHMSLLPRMDERDICAAKLGGDPPRGAPEDWRVLEVVLASVSLITGGPAAVIHSHGPFTTAASCEKDLVLVQPIDEIGKKHIGKIIIVDPDDENPEEFLRQVAEALQQGGMRCVVIRGKGAYAVGADLDQAWANAAMLEHSMKVVLLARQANLKV